MNLVEKLRPSGRLRGRVEVPGVDQGEVEALQGALDWHVRQRRGYLLGMLEHRRPIAARPVPARKRRKPTKHVRRMRAHAARAYFLQGR